MSWLFSHVCILNGKWIFTFNERHDASVARQRIESTEWNCFGNISGWFSSNALIVDFSKTENTLLFFALHRIQKLYSPMSICQEFWRVFFGYYIFFHPNSLDCNYSNIQVISIKNRAYKNFQNISSHCNAKRYCFFAVVRTCHSSFDAFIRVEGNIFYFCWLYYDCFEMNMTFDRRNSGQLMHVHHQKSEMF